MRTYAPSPATSKLPFALYQMGTMGRGRIRGLGAASPAQTAVGLTAAAVPVGTSALATAGAISAAAVPVIGLAVAGITAIVGSLLAAHEQRAADAKNENQAADSASQTFDQVIQAVVQAYNSGQASISTCLSQLQNLQSVMYSTLRSKVGPTGTAWTSNPPSPGAGIPCNKSCTVGCCLYYNDLLPGIIMLQQAFGALGTPLMQAQAGAAGMPLPASASGNPVTSFTVTIPAIDKSSYSDYSRAAYQVTITTPASSVVSSSSLLPSSSNLSSSGILGGGMSSLLLLGLLAYALM